MGGLKKFRGENIFCSKSLKININSTVLWEIIRVAHNNFQIIQMHSLKRKQHYILSLTDTILIPIYTCIFSLPLDIVFSFSFWWEKSEFQKLRGEYTLWGRDDFENSGGVGLMGGVDKFRGGKPQGRYEDIKREQFILSQKMEINK